MYTRKQYLDKECTHEEYYHQFVTANTKRIVELKFCIDRLTEAYNKDKSLNSIPIAEWDYLTNAVSVPKGLMDACDDYLIIAGAVCILKQAARELVEEAK